MVDPSEVALRFVRLVEGRAPVEAIAELLHEDVVQRELPNRLFPSGAVRDKAQLLEGNVKGRSVLSSERYEVRNVVCSGENVALEVAWSGTLAVPYGALPVGHVLRASLGMFLRVRDGRIASIHNYDCYEPEPQQSV